MKKGLKALALAALLLTGSLALAEGRSVTVMDDGWQFLYTGEDSTMPAQDAAWEDINLPHTWNGLDAQDGGNDYRRGFGWYTKQLAWSPEFEGKQVFLRFLGANLISSVYVNGEIVCTHPAGYTAFSCEITDFLTPGESATITVSCDNRRTENVAPQGGDFSVQGGIYRNVQLIVTEDVHVDALDMGASGLYLTTTDVSEEHATLTIRAAIVNESDAAQTVNVSAVLRNPDTFEAISTIADPLFDEQAMAPGGQVAKASQTLSIEPGASVTFEQAIDVEDPHLWNGLEDPYRYIVDLTVEQDGAIVDALSDYVGFRYFTVDPDQGFFLNGQSYPLRGVSRHQDRRDKGYALSREDHETDMGILYDLGANAVRLAHYPQDPYFYELCDRYGVIVWAEIPHVGGTAATEEFAANLKMQLQEMIRQHYNHPSILFWGLQNEINNDSIIDMMSMLNDVAHEEDPTRCTTQAIERANPPIYPTDVLAYNIYPNWYYEANLSDMMDTAYALEDSRPIGISEYGAGASLVQHEENAQLSIGQSRGQWHPEEFQSNWHEDALAQINQKDYLWCTFVWNLFDFASDGKAEGGQLGINDKGLVSHDRSTPKDAYYLYKANWNQRDRFVHITSKRFDVRDYETISVKVYSNCESVTLTVNGETIGTAQGNDIGVFLWEGISLNMGENTIEVVSETGETDSTIITRTLSSTPTLATSSDACVIDNQNGEITLNADVTAASFKAALSGVNGTTWKLTDGQGGEVADDALVNVGMTVLALSQDEQSSKTYVFVRPNLVSGAQASASTSLAAYPLAQLMDMDGKTYWSADRGTSGFVVLDLGDVYTLTDISIDWFNNGMNDRTYLYTVQSSEDGETYEVIADRSENTQSAPSNGSVRIVDALGEARGRYVKIDVTGGPNWSECVEISEIKLDGFALKSDVYEIDHEARTITLPTPTDTLAWEAFEAEIELTGTHTGITTETGAYYVSSGDLYIVIDAQGNEIPYTVIFK